MDKDPQKLIIAGCILTGTVVWTVAALRRMRRKPVLSESGIVEPVGEFPFVIAVAWILMTVVSAWTGPAPKPMTLVAIKKNCLTLGALTMALAAIHSFSNRKTEYKDQLRSTAAVAVGFAGFLAGIAGVLMVQILRLKVFEAEDNQHVLLELVRRDNTPPTIMWVTAMAVVLAPLLEELLYRVLLQGWLRHRMGRTPAIVLVAVIFCVAHGFDAMFGLFPLALVLGYVYDRTNNYLAVVTTHAWFNLVMLAMTLLES